MQPEPLAVGDRFPNVLVADADGQRSLYNRHQGRAAWIVWGVKVADISERLGQDQWVLALGAEDGASQWIEAGSDLHAQVTGPWTVGALLLDPALRVWRRFSASDAEGLLSELANQAATEPANTQGFQGSAPVLVLPRVLEPELCAAVIEHYREHGGRPSGVLQYHQGQPQFTLDRAVKMRRECVITDASLEARVHQRVMQRVLPEILRAFAFTVSQREHFKIIAYAAGAGYFRPHRDNDTPDVAHRRFAMTLNLNTGAYRGGCLRFPEFGPHDYEAEAGGACVFSCSILHEATEVSSGERLAMTTFLY